MQIHPVSLLVSQLTIECEGFFQAGRSTAYMLLCCINEQRLPVRGFVMDLYTPGLGNCCWLRTAHSDLKCANVINTKVYLIK